MSLDEAGSAGSSTEEDDGPGSPHGVDGALAAEDGPTVVEGSGEIGEEGLRGQYGPVEVNDQVFEELQLPTEMAQEVMGSWATYMRNAENREAAGEAIYAAIFDAAPSLQGLFKTPRAVMAMRFMNGLNQIIASLHDPKGLKIIVETLGFQHLDLEVTVPRVIIFRDAIVDLLRTEMGTSFFSPKARTGWCTMLNYVGGSYIFVRVKFADRLRILTSSWATANNKKHEGDEVEEKAEGETVEEEGIEQQGGPEEPATADQPDAPGTAGSSAKKKGNSWFGNAARKAGVGSGGRPGSGSAHGGSGAEVNGSSEASNGAPRNTAVPTTYNEMFMFNAAVMGFGGHTWLNEVLASFDTIVTNVANSYRLQEECDLLSLRMAKYKGIINLGEYKAVMLASLRSLVPKDWNSAHEVAWSWLWENVERMIKQLMGKPSAQQAALTRMYASLDDKAQQYVRREVYARFFALAPAGQDYFKQSTTRLHFIADRLVDMTLEMYRDPKKMVEDISALGLRHVGYGIPTDLFGPFVTACVQVVRSLTDDDAAEEAFRWSLSLVSRILTRVINEGSTIVMKAINANSAKQLRKAVGCAPRGRRALWVLNIQVGTQSISPLLWAIETGSLEAAKAILVDLLTIRADRDRYYFGMDTLFERHPDVVKRLCADAPALLGTLMDGLVWRSRTAEQGMRRVNYYIKHLLVDAEGGFSQALEWLVDDGDPKIICHPVLVMVCDLVWLRVAQRTFLTGKAWFLFTLCIFICGQSILNRVGVQQVTEVGILEERPLGLSAAIFACRLFIYFFVMGGQMYLHSKHLFNAIRNRDFFRVNGILPVPGYLANWQDWASFLLLIFLMAMFACEPILYCFNSKGPVLTEQCEGGVNVLFIYSVWSMCAMLFYFLLLCDLSVFSTRVSAFALVCGRVLSEVGLFLFGFGFLLCAFACAVSSLEHHNVDFMNIPNAALAFGRITLGMFGGNHFEILNHDPVLLAAVFLYVIATVVFLLNLLIAQLNCSYQSTYQDMLGFARLNRGKIVVETMPSVSRQRFERFVDAMGLDERCQFGEGDIGVTGGIQIWELASQNITTVDMIKRFGGTTSPNAQWPTDAGGDEDEDKFERLEKLIEKAMKRMSGGKAKAGRGGSTSGAGSSLQNTSGGNGNSVSDGAGASEHSGD